MRLVTALYVVFSAIAEKQPHKQIYDWVPIVLSAARLVVLWQVYIWGKLGVEAIGIKLFPTWSYWAFGAILSIALPVTSALQRVAPEKVLDFAKGVYKKEEKTVTEEVTTNETTETSQGSATEQ